MPLRARTRIARRLRRDATDVERLLWRAMRERLVLWKFRRQHPIGRRVADFACPARKLVIELDGGQHAERGGADNQRSAELAHRGYRVIRFWNNDVIDNLDGVLEMIRSALEEPPPHPTSPPRGAERGSEGASPPPAAETRGEADPTSVRRPPRPARADLA